MHPSLKFLFRFSLSYLIGNLLYFIVIKYSQPDPFTFLSAWLLDASYTNITTQITNENTSFLVLIDQKPIVKLAEGCNGMAIWISLMAFCIGYGGRLNQYLFLAPISYLLIQAANIIRLLILVQIKVNEPNIFPFFHEYAFPAILYACAFMLMVFWVKYQQKHTDT